MNRSYFFLIGLLVVMAVVVGVFALYRSTAGKVNSLPAPVAPSVSKTEPASPPPPPKSTEEEIVAKNNSLPLTVTSPQDKSEVTTPSITVSGTTASGADVSINDRDLKADVKGKFSTTITLDSGDNYILIVASNENGVSEWQGTVTLTN